MTNIRNALMQAAGTAAAGGATYVEDVFNTTLFTGNSGDNRDFVTGLDMSGEGGMCWFKTRSHANSNEIYDTVRGVNKVLFSDVSNAETTQTSSLTAFNNDGFELSSNISVNVINRESVGWSFRKQEGFFDIVTWTGNGSGSDVTISHNLGSTPGMIIVKSSSHTNTWSVYHTGAGNTAHGYLSETDAFGSGADWSATSTTFNADDSLAHNDSGKTYIAYLFASGNDSASQIFGDDGDEAIIKTGSFTPTGSGTAKQTINLGFEPQWLIIKNATSSQSGNWWIFDNMRGFTAGDGSGSEYLLADTDGAASAFGAGTLNITSQGFEMVNNAFVSSSQTFIYTAIRRGPMKEPSAGTDVYNAVTFTGTGSAADIDSGFPVDLAIPQKRTANQYYNFRDRLRGNKQTLQLPLTSAQYSNASLTCEFDDMNGFHHAGSNIDTSYAANGQSSIAYMFRRYPKVFDVIFYKGTNGGGASSSYVDTYPHNLGVKPEMMILKAVDNTAYALNWQVFHPTALLGSMCNLQDDSAAANGLSDSATADGVRFRDHSTASVIGRTNSIHTNSSSHSYVGFLFASLSGVSAVNKYTGTGNDINVTDLGAAARFVLIKRVDSSGDWYVFDTARGIVAGNDIYSLWNSTSVEVTNTDYIDPHSSGFTITSSAPDALNASGGTYLYLAFA